MMRKSIVGIACLACAAGAGQAASAAEVRPGGALDITVSGFARFLAAYGRLDRKNNLFAGQGTLGTASTFDFLNDTEVHFIARGVHDATGIEYGGTIEFEADTNRIDNTDETWIYVRGGFGELRFGDTDSAANNMKIGGYTVAVGTGGIDGLVVDVPQIVLVDFSDRGFNNNPRAETLNNTKLVYYSPIFSGFQLGLSYTPDLGFSVPGNNLTRVAASGDALARRDSEAVSSEITAGLAYTGLLGPVNLRASLVGAVPPEDKLGSYVIYGGAAASYGGLALAGGAGTRQVGHRYRDDDNDIFNRPFFNLGASYDFERFVVSVSYGFARGDQGPDTVKQARFRDLVFGVEVPLLPGLVLSSELAYFDLRPFDVGDPANNKDNDNFIGVTRLALTF